MIQLLTLFAKAIIGLSLITAISVIMWTLVHINEGEEDE